MTDSPAYSPGREAYRQQQQSLGPPMLERAVSGDTQQESDGSYSRVYLRCYAELPIGQSLAVLGKYNSNIFLFKFYLFFNLNFHSYIVLVYPPSLLLLFVYFLFSFILEFHIIYNDYN